jgi:hypothetical protein
MITMYGAGNELARCDLCAFQARLVYADIINRL